MEKEPPWARQAPGPKTGHRIPTGGRGSNGADETVGPQGRPTIKVPSWVGASILPHPRVISA